MGILDTMKLLVVTGVYPPDIGGPATYTVLLEKWLPREGIIVKVVPFTHVRHMPKILRHVVFTCRVFQATRGVDIVLVQDGVSSGVPTRIACFLARKPYVFRVPGDYAWEQGTARFGVKDSLDVFQTKRYGWRIESLRSLQKWVARGAVLCIAPSKYLKSIAQEWSSTPVECIYNGIELPEDAEKRIPVPGLLISVGRFVSWKGFIELIELVATQPQWSLELVGGGPLESEMVATIERLSLQSRVTLLPSLDRKSLHDKIKKASVYVMNSSYEGLSHTLVEVLALGVPVVVTDVGGNAEVVNSSTVGTLVPLHDTQALANAINEMLQGSTDCNENDQKKRAVEFSISATVQSLIKQLKSICA
jgi:glycosyltransferase involved in cell wall biosynthesis